MLSQPKNRVQAIKSKFENLSVETKSVEPKPVQIQTSYLYRHKNECDAYKEKARAKKQTNSCSEPYSSDETSTPEPNFSYLYSSEVKRTSSAPKPLSRQLSDPGKKLHRSHAFRCDRAQKISSPKRAGSVNSRPEPKMDRKLSKDKLKRLGDVLDEQMRKENFQFKPQVNGEVRHTQVFDSVPDENVPPHILAQYAKVIKTKKQEDKSEAMTDSGVSSETENLEEEKGRVKKISSQFENPQLESKERKYPLIESGNNQYEEQSIKLDSSNQFDGPSHKFDSVSTNFDGFNPIFDNVNAVNSQTIKFNCPDAILANMIHEKKEIENLKTEYVEIKTNLNTIDDLASSYETVKLERKNPHLVLTDTLKKALKQPLPAGPPPKKPPRTFNVPTIPENEKKDTKRKLEKLEQVFKQREAAKLDSHIIAEEKTPKPAICDVSLDKTLKTPANIKEEHSLTKENTSNTTDNIYDIVEEDLSIKQPKEVHYLCTEILDITQRTLLPNQNSSPLKNCFKLNCVKPTYSMLSLPYTRLCTESDFSRNSIKNCCSSSTDSLNQQLVNDKCGKCLVNDDQVVGFKCHLNCKCRHRNSEFYVDEHIYDEPCVSGEVKVKSKYGTLNNVGAYSKSLEDLRDKERKQESIYEILTDLRPSTPDPISPKLQKTDFQKLLQNFEKPQPEPAKKTKTKKSLEHLKLSNVPEDFACDGKSYPITPEVSTNLTVRPDLLPKFEGKISPKSEGKISPKFEGKLSPKFEGKISPKFEGKVSPKLETGKLSLDAQLEKDDFEVGKAEVKFAKKEKKFCTEVRRYKPERNLGYSLTRKNPQLDVDRENLNALMNEIYETVTAACNMENKPGSFPTDQAEGSASEESVKLTRSLTEKRKNYVRRVSSRLAYIEPKSINRYRHQTSICSYKSDVLNLTDVADNKYSTFRSWKSFRASQSNLKMDSDSKFNLTDSTGNVLTLKNDFTSTPSIDIDSESIDERAGCVHIEVPFSRERQLFSVCLLVAIDAQQEATRKMTFPSQVQVPQHIENLIFPETLAEEVESSWSVDATSTQCYSFILTDERGERSYGYCRRVLPEGATECLPLCYCLIGKFRAPGFYYKVLQLIESHHGVSQTTMENILQQLWDSELPYPGESLNLTLDDADTNIIITDGCLLRCITEDTGDSFNNNDKCVKSKSDKKTDQRISERFYDPENNNSLRELMLSLDGIRVKTIARPLEPRAEETSACTLLDSLGAGLLVKVFGSLLLERKLIVRADKLSVLSSLLEGLQSALYPFVWQQPLISCVPSEIQRAVLDAPLPVLAGVLARTVLTDTMEEGMFIDLSFPSLVRCYQGDESSILPTDSYKTLKTALNMNSIKNKDRDDTKTRNVMISEAFLRFFVDILGDFWRFFSIGALKEGDMGKEDVIFDKEAFIKNATSKQNQYFLEWFTETAMFNHFIQNMAVRYKQTEPDSFKQNDSSKSDSSLVDTPTPNFYQLFEERVNSRRTRANVDRSGYKNALNKRVKLLKSRLKDLIG